MKKLTEIHSVEDYVVEKAKHVGEFYNESGPEKKVKRFWALYRKALQCSNNANEHYKCYYLAKGNGKFRKIHAPFSELKSHQKFIAGSLNESVEVSEHAFAYVEGKGIKDMADVHNSSDFDTIVKLDIEGFFDSINFGQVYDVFRKYTSNNKSLCTYLTNMCTLNGKLPQGAPSSPIISNLVFEEIDEVIGEYCKNRIVYTRYSDDMVFSFNSRNTDVTPKSIIVFVRKLLLSYGFKLKEEKIKVITGGGRFNVLGLNVDGDHIRVPKAYKKDIRKNMYYIKTYGPDSHIKHCKDKLGMSLCTNERDYLRKLLGKIQYVLYIEPENLEMVGYKDEVRYMLKKYTTKINPPVKGIDEFKALSEDDILF